MDAFRKMKDEELAKALLEKREALREFRFDVTGTKIRNMKEGKNIKKDIARILTEERSRTLKNRA